jgi:cytochrome b561
MPSKNIKKYDNFAILLHWLIALAIIAQLASGLWMVDAIKDSETQKAAYDFYQYHKSLGLIVLTFSILRLVWRLSHSTPELPSHMNLLERAAAHTSHILLYIFMILIPLLGWAMVSTSSYGLPTIIFGLFEWPHISFLVDATNKLQINNFFVLSHKYMAYSMIALLVLHIAAALKHQFFDKDNLFKRILP